MDALAPARVVVRFARRLGKVEPAAIAQPAAVKIRRERPALRLFEIEAALDDGAHRTVVVGARLQRGARLR